METLQYVAVTRHFERAMSRVIPRNHAFKYIIYSCLSFVALGAGERWSYHLLASPSVTAKWLGVAVAVASPLPWLGLVVVGVSTWDEFQRHVALMGTALAFVIGLLLRTGFYAAQDAKLISPYATFPDLVATLTIWCVGVGAAALYYRTRK
jgi:hypothetical protein